MKTLMKTFAFFVIMIAGTWIFPQQVSAQNENVSLQVFYDELSPYGTWVDDPNYGYIWIPQVDNDFSPYVTNGHWVYTDYGCTWVSDYSWGWAPFHYGRWFVDPTYGNAWIPGTEWGPAWVTWRQANGYYGWTPMGPGININMAFGRSYNVPGERWVFVRDRDFLQYDLNHYCLDRSFNFRIFNNSFVIRNTRFDNNRNSTYVFGPRREDVQRFSGRVINPVHIRDNNRPGQSYDRGYLSIYRPQMQRRNDNGYIPAPRSINRNNDNRSESERYHDNSGQNRNNNYQDRNAQTVQQSNVNPSRNGNAYNTGRNTQSVQQPNVNPSRNGNSYNTGRNTQSGQQPNVNPSRNQRVDQQQINGNSYNTGRSVQSSQQSAVNQQRTQRENSSSPSARSSVNVRQQQARMVVNSSKDKKGRTRQNQPRR